MGGRYSGASKNQTMKFLWNDIKKYIKVSSMKIAN